MSHDPGFLRGKRVLVVDRSPEVRKFIRHALALNGITVSESATHGPLDLVITNNPEQFRHLKIPTVYISSSPDQDISSRCVATIQKPFAYGMLLSTVEVCLATSIRRK
jgi:hypothetical protein